MGTRFRGFFVKCDEKEKLENIRTLTKKNWPETIVKIIKSPCFGIAVKMPDLVEIYSEENYIKTGSYEIDEDKEEKLLQIMFSLEENLPQWSKNFPEQKFVFIDSDCFGGICYESGYVCNNGKKIFIQNLEEKCLSNLLEKAEIQSSWYFEPLKRGYFEEKKLYK